MIKVLAVILARGGSKGIPKKNIANLAGYPLISYSIEAAKKSKIFNKIVVSTDDKKIAKIAREYGALTPFLRSKKLSDDKTTSADALKDAIIRSEKIFEEKYDYIFELPCVAPLRDHNHIKEVYEHLKSNKYDSVISYVCTGEKHPIRLKRIKNSVVTNFCRDYKESAKHSRRQDFEPSYIRNGAIYSIKRDTIINKGNRQGKISYPYIMDSKVSINIDEKFDLDTCNLLIANGYSRNYPEKIQKNQFIFKNKNKKTILITCPVHFINDEIKDLQNTYNIIIIDKKNDKRDLIKNIFDKYRIDIFITNPCPTYKISDALLKKCKYLNIIATPSTGTTHLDINNKKIKIISLKDSGFEKKIFASSEYTFLMLLNVLRPMIVANNKVKQGYWRDVEVENYLRGNELRGKTIGIIGFGRIGSNIAKFAKPFGAKILFYDPYKNKNKISKKTSVSNLLKKSDIIAVCCHLNKETKNMVDENWFKKMKKGVLFINSSRGEIVDEESLIKYLKNGKIKRCAIDVVQNENLKKDEFKNKKILKYAKHNENLIITPHIAGLTFESERKAFNSIIKLIKKNDI